MKQAFSAVKNWWQNQPLWLERKPVSRLVKGADRLQGELTKTFNKHSGASEAPSLFSRIKNSKTGAFLGRNLMDIGFISSVSFFFAMSTLGVLPLTLLAGAGLAGVVGLRGYQEIFVKPEDQTPEVLNKKSRFMRSIQRPGAPYSFSSKATMATIPVLLGMGVAGAIPALGVGILATTQFASLAIFGSVFSISNNIKAARLDRDRGYNVKALPLIRKLNPSWSEKLSVVGNIARNFIAGPVVGLITLPVMLEALKYSQKDKQNECKGKPSYTDQKIAPLYNWKKPRSDSGMSRITAGIAKIFAATAAGVTGNLSEAFALAYPAAAQFTLGEKSHKAYASRLARDFNDPAPDHKSKEIIMDTPVKAQTSPALSRPSGNIIDPK